MYGTRAIQGKSGKRGAKGSGGGKVVNGANFNVLALLGTCYVYQRR